MKRSSKSVIAQLQRDRRFKASCPQCDEHFHLGDTVLFPIDSHPPEEALAAIAAARQSIKERRAELQEARTRMTTRSEKTAASVNFGKIIEKIVPSFAGFSHAPGDCRALFEPVDYLIFNGLTNNGKVESLTFLDVKSGRARLTPGQRRVKAIVEKGEVQFSTIQQ